MAQIVPGFIQAIAGNQIAGVDAWIFSMLFFCHNFIIDRLNIFL
jgi:hypothetical protein